MQTNVPKIDALNKVREPLTILPFVQQMLMQGPQGLAFGTFFSTAEQTEPINICRNKITSIANINDKIRTEYERIFSTIKAPDKPKIIV